MREEKLKNLVIRLKFANVFSTSKFENTTHEKYPLNCSKKVEPGESSTIHGEHVLRKRYHEKKAVTTFLF